MADWVTISALATAGGTLVLAIATFSSVRSANRAARAAERSLLAGLRPVLMPSRLEDPPQKVSFYDQHWVTIEGGRAAFEVGPEAVYLVMGLRNAGAGIAVLHGWYFYPERLSGVSPPDSKDFRLLTRDIYVPAGDTGFWQGAFRDPSDPIYATARDAATSAKTGHDRPALWRSRGWSANDQPVRAVPGAQRLMAGGRRATLEPRPPQPSLRIGKPGRQAHVASAEHGVGMTYTIDDARAYIAQVRWQFARTMPQWPHEYTVLLWRQDLEAEFRAFVALIRREGLVKPWPRDAASPRYHHTYLELGEWEYWTMGEPVDETTLINRAALAGLGLRVDVLPAGQEERHGENQDDAGVGAELQQ